MVGWRQGVRGFLDKGLMSQLLTVSDTVAAQARLQPNKLGARDSRRALTYRQWHQRASRLANALRGLGLEHGERVAVLAYNRVEWLEIYVALARAGLVAVPINFRLVGPEILYVVQHAEARAFIVQDSLVERIQPIRDQLDIPSERFIPLGHLGASRGESARPAGWSAYEGLLSRASAADP